MYYTIIVCLLITMGAQAILWEKEENKADKLLRMPVFVSGEDDTDTSKRGIINNASRLWPNATVIYTINDTLEESGRDRFKKAMEMWENKTCVRFRQRTNETDYVMVNNNTGCWSDALGRKGGKQNIIVGTSPGTQWCLTYEVAHELGHVLGFYHEFQRPDRDEYLKVCYDNMDWEKKYIEPNFGKRKNQSVDSRYLPYDYYSFFHYPRYASISKKTASGHVLPLFVPLKKGGDGKEPMLGQAEDLTGLDVLKTGLLYGCDGTKRLGEEETSEEKKGPCGDSYDAKTCNSLKSSGYCKTYPRTLRPICGNTCQLCD